MDNRELYLSATGMVARHQESVRSLEEYLRALRAGLRPHLGDDAIDVADFLEILDGAFTGVVPPRDETWRTADLSHPDGAPVDGAHVDRVLKSQVLDLEDAAVSGALADDYRSFGRPAGRASGPPRATWDLWYNWSPAGFVECGVEGAFGGWEPGDDTGRSLVPGEVAVMGDSGLVAVPADQVERPVVEIPRLTWKHVADFLWAGQQYE